MRKSNKSVKRYDPPVQLKSETEYFLEKHYLHFINELAPEVKTELKMLAQGCQHLFGKLPDAVKIFDYPESRDLATKVWRTFSWCVSKIP